MGTESLIDALRSLVARHADRIACAYLYGSTARGESRASSDIDVAVLYRVLVRADPLAGLYPEAITRKCEPAFAAA